MKLGSMIFLYASLTTFLFLARDCQFLVPETPTKRAKRTIHLISFSRNGGLKDLFIID
jgi:hypothetical protein